MKMTLFVMCLLVTGAISAYFLSLMSLCFPQIIVKLSEWSSKAVISTEEQLISHHKAFGLVMLVSGIFLVYIAYSTPLDLFPPK